MNKQQIDLSALPIKEFLLVAKQDEIKRLSDSAKNVLVEPAFIRVLNEISQETVFKIIDNTTTDDEANILRRLVDRLAELKTRLIMYSEISTPPELSAEELNK